MHHLEDHQIRQFELLQMLGEKTPGVVICDTEDFSKTLAFKTPKLLLIKNLR